MLDTSSFKTSATCGMNPRIVDIYYDSGCNAVLLLSFFTWEVAVATARTVLKYSPIGVSVEKSVFYVDFPFLPIDSWCICCQSMPMAWTCFLRVSSALALLCCVIPCCKALVVHKLRLLRVPSRQMV